MKEGNREHYLKIIKNYKNDWHQLVDQALSTYPKDSEKEKKIWVNARKRLYQFNAVELEILLQFAKTQNEPNLPLFSNLTQNDF
jgi:hypothetical protein